MSVQDGTEAQSPTTQSGVTEEAIRRRAYEISQSADAGTTPAENWERAKQELEAQH